MKDYRYVFGPVPSRRLGLSLGVDLIPFKTCSLDCVYCECGRTIDLTALRKEYVDYNEVTDELKHYLDSLPELDFITFSGSGEPTLNSRIGDITEYLKSNWPDYNLALLTNGTLLYDPEVRRDIQLIDLVKIS
ncbi:MAG: radical SAM protein, partial [Chitinivibrionales bacterium]